MTREGLQPFKEHELRRLFPLFSELVEFAKRNGLGEHSFSDYIESGEGKTKPIPLPEKFSPYVADHPGTYFVVAVDDRRSTYNRAGTRHLLVRLSTVERQNATDDRIREIDLVQPDPSEGNVLDITTIESVNNRRFETVNSARGTDLDPPHGQAKIRHRIDANGRKSLASASFNRLDEGLFELGGVAKPVRWVRDLKVEYGKAGEQTITYQDYYLVGRSHDPGRETRTQITTELVGSPERPTRVDVRIGYGPPSSAVTLFEDAASGIRVQQFPDVRTDASQPEILRQDPAYSLLFSPPVDKDAFLAQLRGRIDLLRTEWDRPQSVYENATAIESSPRSLGTDNTLNRKG